LGLNFLIEQVARGGSRDLFPTARTFAVRVQWDLHAEFPVTLQHKFFQRSLIFLRGDQEKGLHYNYFLNFELKQKPITPLFSLLCMPHET